MSLLSLLALSFVLGMRHATDADHVVAVTAIVSRERSVRAAAWIGALWGLGHSLTIGLAGGAIVLFRWVVPPRLGLALEMVVAAMLVVLGLYNVGRASGPGAASSRQVPPAAGVLGRLGLAGVLRPLVVGVVHGLAGSAAIALLVVTTIRTAGSAALYLLIFGLGTVAGMVTLTLVFAAPPRSPRTGWIAPARRSCARPDW